MASVLYPLYKEALLSAATNTSLNLGDATNGPFCSLIDQGTYTYSAAHQFYNSAAASAIGPANGVQLTAPTVVAGTFDAADITFTAVTSPNNIEALIIYRHNSGANTTWYLVAMLESDFITGLPVTPNGGDIVVTWNATGIFTL